MRSGTFEVTSIFPPMCSRKVRSETLCTVTPSSSRTAATTSSACSELVAEHVTSTTMRSWRDSATSSAVTIPPWAAIAVAIPPTRLGSTSVCSRIVIEYDALVAALRRRSWLVSPMGSSCRTVRTYTDWSPGSHAGVTRADERRGSRRSVKGAHMSSRSSRKKTAVLVTAAVAVVTAAAGTAAASGRLPVLDRSAQGKVDSFGGAARERGDQSRLIADSIASGRARNVILLIGDGMGDSEITVARNYLRGAGGAFPGIDALPLTGQMTHYSVSQTTGKPDYTPDSASTGTAWSTGVKTYDNAISVDRHGKAYPTLLEQAKRAGFATGDITTSEIQDATPAVEVSHISQRSCYGPVETTAKCLSEAKEQGGRGSISEQLLDTRPDVTMGGGLDDLRPDGEGRGLEGQDARAAGEGPRLHATSPPRATWPG